MRIPMPEIDDDRALDGSPDRNEEASLMGDLALGGESPNEALHDDAEPVKRSLLAHGGAVIALVAVVGAGTLMAMRYAGGLNPSEASNSESGEIIDKWVQNVQAGGDGGETDAANISSMVAATGEVLRELEADTAAKQVPIEQVKKDPFEMWHDPSLKPETPKAVGGPTPQEIEAARIKALRDEAGKLEVSSVIGNAADPTKARVVIGGEIYGIGDEIGSFTIERIRSRAETGSFPEVHLRSAEDDLLRLRMGS